MPVIVSKQYLARGAGRTKRPYRTRSASVRECKGFAAKVAIWLSLMVAEAGCLGHDWLTAFSRAHAAKGLEESLGMPRRGLNRDREVNGRRDIEEVGSCLVKREEDGRALYPPASRGCTRFL